MQQQTSVAQLPTSEKCTVSKITIMDLEVFWRVGVTPEERAKPQRLLVTVDMNVDFSSAAVSDRIEHTINYQQVADGLRTWGEARTWQLLEKMVTDISDWVLDEFKPHAVLVEVKKFVIPQAKFVSVTLGKVRPNG